MEYTLAEVDQKLKIFADKIGSDYFPMPVLLHYFRTSALDFIGEKLKIVEKTQQIVEELRPLIKTGNILIIEDPNDGSMYVAPLPTDYKQLVAYDILYKDGTRCRRADLQRHSEYRISLNDPNKKPDKNYPIILQEDSLFYIDCGNAIPDKMPLTYCKQPTFATTGNKEQRIINLEDDAIEKIILSTVTRLFNSTGDQRSQSNYQLQEAFKKILK